MFNEKVVCYKRIFAKLNFNGDSLFDKIGLIIAINWSLSYLLDLSLLFFRVHC